MSDRFRMSIAKHDLSKQLSILTTSLNIGNQEATLSTLKQIYNNIIKYPDDDKYRQIKLANETFNTKVWQYPAAVEFMKMSGWVVEGSHVTFRDDLHLHTVAELLESVSMPNRLLFKPPHSDHFESVITEMNHDEMTMAWAITMGDGKTLKEMLAKHDASSVRDIKINGVPIVRFVLVLKQIGIARILAANYQIDFNQVDDDGHPYHLNLFHAVGDSNESSQSLIIDFIRDFKLDFTAYDRDVPVLHYAIFLKLFTVLKFLVEEYGVNINGISPLAHGSTCLHVAYALKQNDMVKYLIEHGADQTMLDEDGKRPGDYKFSESQTIYSKMSEQLIRRAKVLDVSKTKGESFVYYQELQNQNVSIPDALDCVFKQFPLLKDEANSCHNLDATPKLRELSHYIEEMAPSYYEIGLQLDIINSQLKLIKIDNINFPSHKEKCHEMLEVWLKKDTSATWKKLCDALEEVKLHALADKVTKGTHNTR